MKKPNNFAYLKRESPFFDLFPDGRCPVINILLPSRVSLEGSSETEAYMINLDKVGNERLSEIARRLAAKAGADPIEVFGEIKMHGLPLRVSQTTGYETDSLAFL